MVYFTASYNACARLAGPNSAKIILVVESDFTCRAQHRVRPRVTELDFAKV